MTKTEQESQFLSMLSLAASKYKLELKIDPDTRNIDLIGKADQRNIVACAVEIGELAETYRKIVK